MKTKNQKLIRVQNISNLIYLVAFILYMGLIVLLLLSELGVLEWLRATNQVLILASLLFLPFLLISFSRVISSLKLRLPGQEIEVEIFQRFEDVQLEVKNIGGEVSSQISNAEQALWPILVGNDMNAYHRWQNDIIVIGSKEDVSQVFFAYFLAEWIESTVKGVRCELRVPNGGTLKNFADLKYQWVDIYVDFTGTLCQFFNIDHQLKSPSEITEEIQHRLKHIGIYMLNPLGASEDYCLVVTRAVSEKYGLKVLPDLQWIANELVFSGDPEFLNRKDCYLGMVSTYNMKFKRIEVCSVTERYKLLDEGEVDVAVGYSTDSELRMNNFVVLEDIDRIFPHYKAVPLVSQSALSRFEGLEASLMSLHNKVTTDNLVDNILKLQKRGLDPAIARSIAHDFCQEISGNRQ